jgi:hypothetical protein
MLHETYATETNRPASSTWQTVFVFGESSVQRVDTPELPKDFNMKTQKKAQKAARQKAYLKAYYAAKADDIKAKHKAYRAAKADHIKAKKKAYRVAKADDIKAKYKAYYAAKADDIKAKHKAYRAAKADDLNAKNKAYRAAKADDIKAYSKAYYAAKADDIKTRTKAYRVAKADDIKAKKKAYYAAKVDDIKAKYKAYYAAKTDDIKARNKAYRQIKLGCLECKDWPDPRQGWPHYDGYCFRCFSHKFKDNERVKSRGRVELRVRSYLDSHFPDFVHDQPIHTAHCVCSHRRRVDHRKLIGNTLLCVETDENFHKYYDPDDEEARYHDVIMAWGGKLCFVRFNPHKFNLDDRRDHGPPLDERLERLRAEVTRHIERLERGENTAYLEVHHLYYPEGTPDLYEEQCKPEWLEAGATSI